MATEADPSDFSSFFDEVEVAASFFYTHPPAAVAAGNVNKRKVMQNNVRTCVH